MAVFSCLKFGAFLALASVHAQLFLAPPNDILLPTSDSAKEPLQWLAAGSPYFAGPDINGISNEVPEGCTVEQVSYNLRHGSRYPDTGAYKEWTTLHEKVKAATFKATGSMAFFHTWKPVLTDPAAQIAQLSNTGYKEAHDLGYMVRTRYAHLYKYGESFTVWANLYPRAIQTAQSWLRGFMGHLATASGRVISVDAKNLPAGLFNSLSPSDLCPNFVDGNGGDYQTKYKTTFLPAITARLNALITGDLKFTDNEVFLFPYLCGFESQITGTLSPFCSIFTDDELKQYEYAQDLRYYYGVGPGMDLPSKMMLPYLNSLVGLLAQGPGINGTSATGESFKVPDILMVFFNDGQTTELGAATGVWDDAPVLGAEEIPSNHKYTASHFVSMRGTVAFERLHCPGASSTKAKRVAQAKAAGIIQTTAEIAPNCAHDNCLRQLIGKPKEVAQFCPTYTATTGLALPNFVSNCGGLPSRVSSACSCLVTPTAAPTSTSATTLVTTTSSAVPTLTPIPETNKDVFIRILLNDAVYPVPSCQDGPGRTCGMNAYVDFLAKKMEKAGNLLERCNVTAAGSPKWEDIKGAGFLTDLSGPGLASIVP
ncbi:related to 3-phytase B precursor [Rhynchosporium graminicola]|uniref:Related to 3-phytase B n=1 Tax=Rhynchosporium graminicola TaxID=2792576 RepID=A0A1E1L696_9HELO|nr:related to 3-phytase B precursor [Rhynchosporium commune]